MPRKADAPEPIELWAEALDLEARALELRRDAMGAALERAHGLVGAAARLLGLSRSALRNMLDGGQYPKQRARALELRQRAGYTTGRAPADIRIEEGDDA